MANSAQARKRARQAVKHRLHNHSQKSETRTAIKRVLQAIHEGKLDIAKNAFKTAAQKLDRLAGHDVIHANTASRLKSRLNAKLKAAAK